MPLWKRKDHRFLLFLADLHAFHACGLVPREFVTSTGNRLLPNEFQSYLLECYEHLLAQLPQSIDGLFLVGDIHEGQNLAETARELSEVDPEWQVRGTSELLHPITSRVVRDRSGVKNIRVCRGSRYHTGIAGQSEESLGRFLGAQQHHGYYAPPWWRVMCGPVMLDVAHHQSFTIVNRSMPMERELRFLNERAGKNRRVLPEIVVIVRAHTHTGLKIWEESGAICISLPAFKLQDTFAQMSRTPNRLIPDNLGAVGLRVYDEPIDGTYVQPVRYLYEHPEDQVTEMTFA